ncbi:hypothetical protein DMB68_21845 [Flavobacterium hydrophilum]|uniref:Uncharacterized protein n=2 Tax=Flavobacterium hydrophilum TaxID=2211445 RepID=A0A2V4CA51_9FLAO|nr:hypothetical protein DMB68_21845 [Flavobacterium hydrophilum]
MLSNCKNNEWVWKSTLKSIGTFFKELSFLIIGYKPKKKNKLGEKFYDHPIIKNYGSSDRFSIPSYIPKENFSTILIEVLDEYWNIHKDDIVIYLKEIGITNTINLENLPRITKINYLVKYLENNKPANSKENCDDEYIDQEILKILALYLNKSYQNIETFTAQLETWYDDSMNRVSGWYKRQTQFILFFLGLAIAITFNVDIIDIAGKLSTDKDARDKLVEMAIKEADQLKNDSRVKELNTNVRNHEREKAKKSLTPKQDSTYIDEKNERDTLLANYNKHIDKIRADLDGNIKDANNLLAVGWDDYGFKKDSSTYIKKYSKCFIRFKDTIRKTDSLKYFKTKALLNQFQNDTSIIGKKKLEELKKISKQDSIFYKDTIKLNQRAFIGLYKSKQYRIKASYVLSNFYKGRRPLGYLLLAFGICLGAPFWFDLLQKLIKIRASGKKEETGDGNSTSSTLTSPPIQVTVHNSNNPEAIG